MGIFDFFSGKSNTYELFLNKSLTQKFFYQECRNNTVINKFRLYFLYLFLFILPYNVLAQENSTFKLKFGSRIDSVYNIIRDKYGVESINFIKGEKNPFNSRSDADSLLYFNKGVVLFDNQHKTSICSIFYFQINPNDNMLRLSQIIHLVGKYSKDFYKLVPKVYDSYYTYFSALYDDIEHYSNDFDQKCFRFGKGLYSRGAWFGTYYVTQDDNGYNILLIYTVPQNE